LEDVYLAIAYYLSHRLEIDAYLNQRRQKAQHQRIQFVQLHNLVNLRQRLIDRSQTQIG
jgi:hypothetical protein